MSDQDLKSPVSITPASAINGGGTAMVVPITIPVNAIATTSTDGEILTNTTAATGGATVQMSPRLRWRGTAWDTAASETVDFFAELLPASAATPTGTWRIGYSLNGGGVTYPFTLTSAGLVTLLAGLDAGANISVPAGNALIFSGQTRLSSPGVAQFNINNTAITAGIGLDVSTDSVVLFKNRAQNAAGGIGFAALAISGTAPTISSGFGTSPSVAASNGTAAFTVNVGTGGVATAGVIGMPTAATGWIANVKNLTQLAANRADRATVQTASTTASITVQSVIPSTGAATAWTASDILQVTAIAY